MGSPAPVPRLRGREAEHKLLGEALDRVASGRPATVLIEGEAGIGKTRLLEQVFQDARARGMQVAAGRADELERARPFGLLADVFDCAPSSRDPQRAAIAALLATKGGSDEGPITVTSDPGLQFRAVDAFGDLAEVLALSGPLVIGADDLQWADPSSLLTLAAIGRRLTDLPVAIIGCFRPTPRAAELDRLVSVLAAAGARQLALHPLDAEAVRDLVSETVAAVPGPGLLAEVSGAAGNPLFVTELVGALLQEGAIQIAGGRAEVAEATLPPTLRLTILRRLSFLPEDILQVLQVASILGSAFWLTDLAVISGRPAVGLTAPLAEAIRARVIEDDGVQLRFRHDLIRDSIYEDLPASVRRGLHREAGERLAQSGAPPLRVAEHFARGATEGDSQAIAWLTRAARDAAAGSPAAAASLLDRAITLMKPGDPGRDRLLAEQAGSLMWAGRLAEAEAACRVLLDRDHDPSVTGSVRNCLAHALLAGGRAADALRELELAVSSAELAGAERASARGWESFARLSLGDLDGAAAAAREAWPPANAASDHLTASVAVTSLALADELRGNLRSALQLADRAVSQADKSPARVGHRYPVHAVRGLILIDLDRLEDASSTLATGMRIGEELGARLHLPSYQVFGAYARFTAGDWDGALAEAQASLELAEEIGETYTRVFCHSLQSLICLHRNDLPAARAAATMAAGELSATGQRYRSHWSAWATALIAEADGNTGQAFAALAGCWDQCARLGLATEYRVLGPDLARLALANGEPGRARDAAAAVAGIAERNDTASLTGAALHCQGLAEDDAGVLATAAHAYEQGRRPLELARACEDAGAAFARRDEPGQARPLIEQALDIYEHLDAARDLARADAALRRLGVRRGSRTTRKRPQFGWESLTPTELTVASLVADGLSNPQIGARLFVSRRTVQAHLAHVFAKLGISSRAQLAAEVTRRREGAPETADG